MNRWMLFLILFFSSVAWANVTPQFDSQFISVPRGFHANHGSTLVQLPGQKLMACWYAGAHELAPDVQIVCSEKSLKGGQWSMPRVLVRAHEKAYEDWFGNKSLGNPVLFLDSQHVLWLFYSSVKFGGWWGSHVDYKVSRDFGETWSLAHRLTWGMGVLTRIKPLALRPGEFMMPLYHESFFHAGYTCIVKTDDGDILNRTCADMPGHSHIQPALVLHGDHVWAYLRNRKHQNILFTQFDFKNNSWAKPALTNLPNPDSSVDALPMSGGRVLLAYNHSSSGRSPLSLAITQDGLHFTRVRDIENSPGHEYSYPAMIQTSDGFYQLSYTHNGRDAINHVRFNEAWVSGAAPLLTQSSLKNVHHARLQSLHRDRHSKRQSHAREFLNPNYS